MRLLQVALTAGLLAHLAVAGPLFLNDEEYDDYDYYDDYNYDDYFGEEEESPTALEEPEVPKEPDEPLTAEEGHGHHHHHHHPQPMDSDNEVPVAEEETMALEGAEHPDGDAVEVPVGKFVDDESASTDDLDLFGSTEKIFTEEVKEGPGNATVSAVDVSGIAPHKVPMVKYPKDCVQPPDPGVCRGYFPMFYFDPDTHKCLQFIYGGCRGNPNAFRTAEECYKKCHPIGHTRGDDPRMGVGRSSGRGDYLTMSRGRGDDTFTFQGRKAALKLDDDSLDEFSVRNVYQIEFSFRTDLPHGLIAFLRQTEVPPEVGNRKVQLYVFLRRGHLGVTHVFCCNRETFIMTKGGLQVGNWHSSLVKIDAATGQLILEVDGIQENFTIESLTKNPHYDSYENSTFTPRLWLGGVFDEEMKEEAMVDRSSNFHGCLMKVSLMSGETSEEMVRHKGLSFSSSKDVTERCKTNCVGLSRNLCSPRSVCVEHFDHSTCNCFGSGKGGYRCTDPDIPTLSLSNDGYVVHRLYDWMDRVHSYTNLISLEFRTRYADSILFYGSAEYPEKQYIAASLTAAGTVYLEVNLGGGAVSVEVGERVQTGTWNTLTIIHQHERIQVHLNSRLYKTLIVPGEVRYFHLDPEFYFGNAPNLTRTCGLKADKGLQDGYYCERNLTRYYYDVHDGDCHAFVYTGCGGNGNNFETYDACLNSCRRPGLRSMHSFLGCMKNVYINDVSVLWELREQNKTTSYRGVTKLAPFTDTCRDRAQMMLLTLSTARAHVNLTHPDPNNFRIAVSFRPTRPRGVVASGYVDVMDNRSVWEILHDRHHVSFVVHDKVVVIKPNTRITIGSWQYVDVKYRKGRIVMRVNHKTVSNKPKGNLYFQPSVSLGRSLIPENATAGMVGCVRKVLLGTERVELRSLAGTDIAQKDVIYDACRVLGPCDRQDACEHNTTCTLDDNDDIMCNCSGSGYTGRTCHFSLYKESCEQYRHIGYNTSGVYKIDLDGNGPYPPAFVKCDFNPVTGVTSTIVENNLPEKYEVRGPHMGNVKVDVEYRDFCPSMLKTLVAQSESCVQEARYDCRRSPMKLSTHTWFSSPSNPFITKFGSKVRGLCRCKEINSCSKPDVACNCDAVDGLARFDEVELTDPEVLPITSMVFLEDSDVMREESEGRMTVSPLTCTNKAAVEQVVSFSKGGVYLEVPAWREGSLSFSFKTTSSSAMIAYQPAYHPSHASFRIALLGDKQLEFMYSFHGLKHRHSLYTHRPLNSGEWQQLLIDVHRHQLRFVVNSEQKLIDIDRDANLGVLDGSMFLGGMPERRETWKNPESEESEELDSLKGCIRDLTYNGEEVQLDRYVRAAPVGVSDSCKSPCNPNPCVNGAECTERRGSYECVCKNPLAHSGENCEIDLNEDGITFTTLDSKIKYFKNTTVNFENTAVDFENTTVDFENTTVDFESTTVDYAARNLLNAASFHFNFRTHSTRALIIFAYDYLHNFLQLHLAASNQLTMLFNSGGSETALTVQTEGEVVLNGGQSVQVAVERSESSTTLTVHTSGVSFTASTNAGLQLIQDDEYEQFPFGDSTPLPDMVYYPHSPTKPGPFYSVYVGSANDPQMDVRSYIPGFVGCLRGAQVDSTPVSLRGLLRHSPADGVKPECSMLCDDQPCLNGGTCTEDFRYPSNFFCDCSGTSYTGPVCTSETAYTFHGDEWLSRDAPTSPLVEDMVLELAFSSSSRHPKSQIVAFLRSTSEDTKFDFLLVSVEPSGAVTVRYQKQWSHSVATAAALEGVSTFSGHRHAVRVEWTTDDVVVTVDRRKLEFVPDHLDNSASTEVMTTPRGLYLGGVEEGVDSRLRDYTNFHGCISNVKISSVAGKVFPLEEYKERDRHITNSGFPVHGSCDGFPVVPVMVMMHRANQEVSPVHGSDWVRKSASRQAYAAPPPMEAQGRNTSFDNVVPAVATTAILVAFLVMAALCVKNKTLTKKSAKKEKEETKKLLNLRKSSKDETKKSKVHKISEVEMPLLKPETIQNGGAIVEDVNKTREVNQRNEVNQKRAPPSEPPPPVPTKDLEDKEVDVRTPKESVGDRPLSWDKSTDTMPLIIGSELKAQMAEGEEAEGSSSEGSSFDCTIEITKSPPSSPVLPSHREVGAVDSPSSTRAHRGSSTMINLDEDTDTEPRLLHHNSLSPDDARVEVVEPPVIVKKIHLLGDGEVQKIVKSEDEDEIIVVDDYLENVTEDATALPSSAETNEEAKLTEGTQPEEDSSQQKENELVEAAQDNQTEEEIQTKTEQTSESTGEEKETPEEKQETDDNQEEEQATKEDKTEEEEKTEGEEQKEKESEDKSDDGKKRDQDSDEDFIELQPDVEKVQDAQRVTSQLN